MNIVLTAIEPALAGSWRRFCGGVPGVSVHEGSILEVACDAVVSPANSYGFLDGGIDAVYRQHFGAGLQERLREAIEQRHHGELLVGLAEVVETENAAIPFLIAAPTMRVPMILRDSPNAYLAARAVLLLLKHGRFPAGPHAGRPVSEVIRTVAFPGLCTGIGGMGVSTCAHQVRAALDDVLLGAFEPPRTWAEASERHQLLYTDRVRRLQHEP